MLEWRGTTFWGERTGCGKNLGVLKLLMTGLCFKPNISRSDCTILLNECCECTFAISPNHFLQNRLAQYILWPGLPCSDSRKWDTKTGSSAWLVLCALQGVPPLNPNWDSPGVCPWSISHAFFQVRCSVSNISGLTCFWFWEHSRKHLTLKSLVLFPQLHKSHICVGHDCQLQRGLTYCLPQHLAHDKLSKN